MRYKCCKQGDGMCVKAYEKVQCPDFMCNVLFSEF